MVAKTAEGAWIVPPRHALWIPPATEHEVEMRAAVAMRTVYIRAEEAKTISASCKVIAVSPLLREAILALMDEPVLYCEEGRGGALAKLVTDEITRAAASEFELPLPLDTRLCTICKALIDNPALARDIDGWSDLAGLSRRTLTRKFRQETGLSFGNWRRRLRALSAAAQIADGASAQIAAAKSGYRHPSALRSMMRRV
jgi:AraC-like DNA-binding protein